MTKTLADRLRQARHTQFVGRRSEIDLFQSALEQPTLPFYVLYIHGVGGVGKSTLLQEFAYACRQRGVNHCHLDARNFDPLPDAFLEAFRQALAVPSDASPFEALGEQGQRCVLLVDTYEQMEALDDWFREDFLMQLPDNVLIVMASRRPPAMAWRTDPGWQALLRDVPLRNLTPNESRHYLAGRGVPVEQQQSVLEFTHCHPLALSLAADTFRQREGYEFAPQESPDLIRALLKHLIRQVPGPDHRATLELCGLVRVVTESLLSEVLERPDVHDLFRWLSSLSFIHVQSEGLAPHDLARDAIVADLRWRSPVWYQELHGRVRQYYNDAFQRTPAQSTQILIDYIFLHRDNAAVRSFFDWQSSTLSVNTAQPDDFELLTDMVARQEGDESCRIAAYWFGKFPECVLVCSNRKRELLGFLVLLPLHRVDNEQLRHDPAARAAVNYLNRYAPLRPGEVATLFRFWMASDTYQDVSPVTSLIFVHMVRHYLSTQGLAFTLLPCAQPDFWVPMFDYAGLMRIQEADFTVGGHTYGMYGHDWRARPPAAWLDLLASRELEPAPALPEARPEETLVVMSRDAFEAAVRDALRNLSRFPALQNNALLRSRLVVANAELDTNEETRLETLQQLLQEAVNRLSASPKDRKVYRALYHTFIQPAPTQEQAAEILDLPYSTYRRHLKAGMDAVSDYLWRLEIKS